MDPPMPPDWTVADYVSWSARLGGVSRADASSAALQSIRALELDPMAKTRIGRLVRHARRATVVAAALATGAEVVCFEDPLGGLPDAIAEVYAKLLVAALGDRAFVVFAPRVSLASPLALAADEAIVATASRVDAQGAPSEIAAAARRFVGRLDGPPSVVAPAIEARGGRIEAKGAHIVLDLGEMTTSELMAACRDAGVAVLELLPVARALS
jgi:ABC-2 type transport system ATP-binding protein